MKLHELDWKNGKRYKVNLELKNIWVVVGSGLYVVDIETESGYGDAIEEYYDMKTISKLDFTPVPQYTQLEKMLAEKYKENGYETIERYCDTLVRLGKNKKYCVLESFLFPSIRIEMGRVYLDDIIGG